VPPSTPDFFHALTILIFCSVSAMRGLVASYYKTNHVARGSGMTAGRHVKFTLQEPKQLVISASVNEKMAQRMP